MYIFTECNGVAGHVFETSKRQHVYSAFVKKRPPSQSLDVPLLFSFSDIGTPCSWALDDLDRLAPFGFHPSILVRSLSE